MKRLTDMAGPEEAPAISPDGKMVAFVAMSVGRRQIWTLQIPGGTPRAITKDDSDHFGPRWPTDSSSLLYFANGAIWEIPTEGGDARRMADAVAPGDLSHDGKTLAFFRAADGAVELAAGTRMVAKLTGGAYSNLRWSPDDQKIAYMQGTNVMVVSVAGGAPVRASGEDLEVQGFAWAPDNSGLIVSKQGGELWFIPRKEGSPPTQLTFGELSYESPDIGPTGNLVVSRRGLATGAGADIVMFTGLKW